MNTKTHLLWILVISALILFRISNFVVRICHFAFSPFPFDFLLVFNAFPAFYSLTIRMFHFPHLADQICFFYNLFCDAPTG